MILDKFKSQIRIQIQKFFDQKNINIDLSDENNRL